MENLILKNEEIKCNLRSARKDSNQYRATRLWNDLIRDFQSNIFCKKHRRYLKTHDNCFTGATAIDVMHTLLQINDNFSFEISRNQVWCFHYIYFKNNSLSKPSKLHKLEQQIQQLIFIIRFQFPGIKVIAKISGRTYHRKCFW